MHIVIGGPIRNRGWILQQHLDALKDMRVPSGVTVTFLYLLNDSTDNTEEILKRNRIPYFTYDTNHASGCTRGKYHFENLSDLRNAYMRACMALSIDAILSIDSDVIVPKHALENLIEDDKDIVSMLLCNEPLPMKFDRTRAHNVMKEDGHGLMRHILDFPMDELFPCDLTGACYLIKRAVIASGCEYRMDVQGEDIPFCRDAKMKGFSIYCDSRIRPLHYMQEGCPIQSGRIIREQFSTSLKGDDVRDQTTNHKGT